MFLNYRDKILKMTEDLVIALFLGNSTIHKNGKNGKHRIHIFLSDNKYFILQMYLAENRINSLVLKKEENECESYYVLESSLILERVIREWTQFGKVVSIDPRYINQNMFMIWICLFGEKMKKDVVIKHNNLTYEVQKMLIVLFKQIVPLSNITTNKFHFKINSYEQILLESIKHNRPSYESAELEKYLSQKDRERLGLSRARKEDDHTYAYR